MPHARRVGGWFKYNGMKRTLARREAAQEVLPQYQALRQQVIDCMPSWARYAGTPSWAQMTIIGAKLVEVAKLAAVPEDDRGFADAVAFMLFDHFLAVITKQEAEALLGWMVFQAEGGNDWYLTPRARDGLTIIARDEAFIALRRKLDLARRKYDGMDHAGPGIPVALDPYEAAMMVAQRMGRELGTELYHMVRGKA